MTPRALPVLALVLLAGRLEAGFLPKVDSATGSNPVALVQGDFNRDGKLDVATVDSVINCVSILIGNGDGTFQGPVTFTVGAAPLAIAIGDFNRDGKDDLAVASYVGTVSILLGNGDGTFAAPVDIPVGTHCWYVAVGDWNGDGKPDLAVADPPTFVDPGKVWIVLGNGNGTFQAPVSYGVGIDPIFIAAGDWNGDGKPDLAVATSGSNDVTILTGVGDGTFVAAASLGVSFAGSVATGDFNGDGKADIAAVNELGTVVIFLGNGDATFQAGVGYPAGDSPRQVAVGDFNLDGKPDLAVTNTPNAFIAVLRGNGDGTFQAAVTFGTGLGPSTLAVADFNGDGKPDLATANGSSDSVSVLRNDITATACACAPAVNFSIISAVGLAVGDFNRDGKGDLVVASRDTNRAVVFLGDGAGGFSGPALYPVGAIPLAVVAADFNRDGKLDLVVAGLSSNLSLLMGNGDGTFQAAVSVGFGGASAVELAAGDLNGDGKLDLVVVNDTVAPAGQVSVLLGNGNGTFQSPVSQATVFGSGIALGDFDRDGKLDVALTNRIAGQVSILLGNGDGTVQVPVNYATTGGGRAGIALGDFDRDGKLDLAVGDSLGGKVSILLGNGNGTFQAFVSYPAGVANTIASSSVAVADFDGDGKVDLATISNSAVSILPGNGNGTFQSPATYPVGSGAQKVAVGDFNGDGKPDVAATSYLSSNLAILRDSCRYVSQTFLASFQNPSLVGQTVILQADVSPGSLDAGIPIGSVFFTEGPTLLGAGTLSGASAQLAISTLPAGSHSITASYSGDSRFVASTSPVLTQVVVDPPDLGITITDGQTSAFIGAPITYTIVVTNPGPSGVTGAVVSDTVPAAVTGVTWSCATTGGAVCVANGSGDINDTVTLPAGAAATYTLSGTVGPLATATLGNTASVAMPAGAVDPNPANNSATDTDAVNTCNSAILVVPDGRLSETSIGPGTTLWFGATLRIGNSYSVEFANSTDGGGPPGVLTLFRGDDLCFGVSTLSFTDVSGFEPAGSGGAVRQSFIASTMITDFRARLVNGTGSAIPLRFSWSDTTMFSPAWSTNGSFNTFYSFQNTTATTLQGTLTLLDTTGAVLSTFNLTVPAEQTASTNASTLVGSGKTGTARLTHNGPPGAIVAEAAIANFAISPAYVQPVKFVAVREAK